MTPNASERGAQSIHRTLRVLQCFTATTPTVSLTELTQQTGLTMSTAHRIVKALQSAEYLTQDSLTSRYALGPAVMRLARVIMQRAGNPELTAAAMPYLERLRSATGETVGLHLAAGDGRYCVAEFVSQQPIRLSTGVGHTYPLHVGAAGRAILAWSNESVVDAVLAEQRDASSARALRAELARIRTRGCAISVGDVVPGSNAISAPIVSDLGVAIAAINVTGPADRWSRKKMAAHAPELIETATEVSRVIGHGQPS